MKTILSCYINNVPYVQGKAWEYAGTKGLSYPAKSSRFRSLVKVSEILGKLAEKGNAILVGSSIWDALSAEWDYANK